MSQINDCDYSILTEFFTQSVIEEFKASAINPFLCLLNAEFLTGDQAIAELLQDTEGTHTNNGSLRKQYRDTYASIIADGGTSYTGIDIENSRASATCMTLKSKTPRTSKDGKVIKYENPLKTPCTAFYSVIDADTCKLIFKGQGIDIPADIDVDREWLLEEIVSGKVDGVWEWKNYCIDLSIKFWQWIIDNPKLDINLTEGCKKSLSGIGTGEICIGLSGIWNGTPGGALLPSLKLLAVPDRNVTIAFDRDSKRTAKDAAYKAITKLTKLLLAEKCEVFEAKWDGEKQGKGIDDLIAKCGTATFHKIIGGAFQIKPSATDDKASKEENKNKPSINFFVTSLEKGLQVIISEETATKEAVLAPVGNHIEAIAYVENIDTTGAGILLEFQTQRKQIRRFTVPRTTLVGDGLEALKFLADRGYHYIRSQKILLLDYLFKLGSETERVYEISDKTGWVKGSFLTPSKTYGDPDLRFREPEPDNIFTEIKGTLAGWKSDVAAKCAGNSRLIFSLGTVFAAPLLEPAQIESGGFHLVGTTSIGKTTALYVAASVTGLKNVPNWRSTSNALEGKAAEFNHMLLPLDELNQADPQTVGASAYMLGNGQGKARMTKTLTNTKPKTWELLFLSTGEFSMTDYLKQSKITVKGGMEARMPSIPADVGKGYGAFENIHGYNLAKSFVDALETSVRGHQGTALDEYLTRLVESRQVEGFDKELRERVHSIASSLSQQFNDTAIGRVAVRFALVQVGLELAHGYNLLPFPIKQCEWSVKLMFDTWVNSRGGAGSIEIKEACKRIEYLFVSNQHSDRIADPKDPNRIVRNLLAYKVGDTVTDDLEYCVPTAVFDKEFADGVEKNQLIGEILGRGWLKPSTQDGRKTVQRRIDGKRVWVYAFKPFWNSSNDETGDIEKEVVTLVTLVTGDESGSQSNTQPSPPVTSEENGLVTGGDTLESSDINNSSYPSPVSPVSPVEKHVIPDKVNHNKKNKHLEVGDRVTNFQSQTGTVKDSRTHTTPNGTKVPQALVDYGNEQRWSDFDVLRLVEVA